MTDSSSLVLTANEALRVDATQRTVARQAVAWEKFAPAIDGPKPFPLFGTGVGLNRGEPDPHWRVIDVDAEMGFTATAAVVGHAHWEWDWVRQGSREAGQFICLNEGKMPPSCHMTFRTEFDLTGFDPATATIDGRFMADDWIVEVRLNGKKLPLGNHKTGSFCTFYIGEGFVAGKNTVEMVVENDPFWGKSPMGLCVQWKGAARRARQAEGEK